jgi:hypothetical protein
MTTELPLDDLITPLTVTQCKTSIYNILTRIGVSTTTWKPGAVVRTIVAACAIIMAGLSVVISNLARSGFLLLSSGSWLTVVAKYVYGVNRNLATFATGYATFTNTGGGIYNKPAGTVTVKNSTTGKTYRTTAALVLNGVGSATVAVQAVEAGSLSNAAIGQIDKLVTGMNKVTCANAGSLVASDDEADSALKLRCLEKLATLSPNGPPDAYSYYAKAATRLDGSNIGVTRTRIVTGPGDGSCHVYAATDSGPVPGDVNDTSTDLGALNYYMQVRVVPPGGSLVILSAYNITVNIAYEAWIYSTAGKTAAQSQAAILLALQESFAVRPIGGDRLPSAPDDGFVFRDDIAGTIKAVFPDDTFHVVVSVPSADVACAVSGIPVLGTVTGNVNIVVKS